MVRWPARIRLLLLSLGVSALILALWFLTTAPPVEATLPAPPSAPASLAPLEIPKGKAATLDGICNPTTEYNDASAYPFPYPTGIPSGTLYLKHDGTYLYVCLRGRVGTLPERFARVYLDTDNGREEVAQEDDVALQVGEFPTSTLNSYKGTGVPNGYIPIDLYNWNALATVANEENIEYQIPLALTGGRCGKPFGLAVYHHWLRDQGDDAGWPSAQFFDRPNTWQEVALQTAPCQGGRIAYVYYHDIATGNDFKTLLQGSGFTVDLIKMDDIFAIDFSIYDLIIIADDTGDLDEWGVLGQAEQIQGSGKPIMGLGEGGYAYFGRLGALIGWPHGWHGPETGVNRAPEAAATQYYTFPNPIGPDPVILYPNPVNTVGIFLGRQPPPTLLPIGLEPPTPDHAAIAAEDCYQLWGFSNGPIDMSAVGRRLFVNGVVFGLNRPCIPTPPKPDCVILTKRSVPPDGTTVNPGDVIQYFIDYQISEDPGCVAYRAMLIDPIPTNTLYVPGSASDGISPQPDGTLVWSLGTLSPGASGTKSFKVLVQETQCTNPQGGVVINEARMQSTLGLVVSNQTFHPVECPPIVPENPDQPPYAEDEIEIYPYPLIAGQPAEFSVRVRNLSDVTRTVTVTFQTSPHRFGIGLGFNAIPVPGNPRVVTLTPFSLVEVKIYWTPPTSGHYCIQVRIESPGFPPIFTQRNLDVSENLQPGVEDILPFKVGNPTTATANITLTVDNTCPGWTAWVSPTALTGVGPNSTDIRDAELHVTPPVSGVLGTACHIDVQGWINDRLIGGIRKLDVPPVHLPPGNPWWLEQEITLNPNPPIVGQPTQYCVILQNPLPISRTVQIIYHVADFGAGIPFTPIATQTVTLPPNSTAPYCITWTPTAGGTLHRCLLIKLRQTGFQDQTSQRNVNLQPAPRPNVNTIPLDIKIGNTARFTRLLRVELQPIGLPPDWTPVLTPELPIELGPGAIVTTRLRVEIPPVRAAQAAAPPAGDSASVDVEVFLDEEPVGGFTFNFAFYSVYLPVVLRVAQ